MSYILLEQGESTYYFLTVLQFALPHSNWNLPIILELSQVEWNQTIILELSYNSLSEGNLAIVLELSYFCLTAK